MRIRLATVIIAGVAFAAGCHSESTAPDTSAAATDAAQQLFHLADSLQQNGGSAGEVGAYRGIAALLVGTGRLSSVTISVDGTPAEYLATAQEVQFAGCPPQSVCTMMLVEPQRTLIAWQKSDPRRVVQLLASASDVEMPYATGDALAIVTIPSLLYFDGSGSLYSGSTATRSVSVTTSDTPCTAPVNRPAVYPAPWPCTQAEFTVAFDGSAQLVPLEGLYASDSALTPSASASPSHRISMASQQVHGSHLDIAATCYACADSTQPGGTPPVTMPWRDSLSATLTTTTGSDVTFTFTVTNTRDSTAMVRFNDSQQFDIRVWDASEKLVWRWGADQAFTQVLTTRTLAPGESARYVAHWKPASSGSYHAMAYLTSSSHGAVAFANVTAP
jgi:hypothetical protein